jgi:hypothetical protein
LQNGDQELLSQERECFEVLIKERGRETETESGRAGGREGREREREREK